MNLEQNRFYQETLRDLNKYHEHPEGLTQYLGTSRGDQIYPKQLNTLLGLIIKLHQRISEQDTELQRLHLKLDNIKEISANIDVLGTQLATLNLGETSEQTTDKKKPQWTFW